MFCGLPIGQTHNPHERFNLFHIDRKDVVIESFKVSLFEHHTNSLENGIIHLTSRGIVFDSD